MPADSDNTDRAVCYFPTRPAFPASNQRRTRSARTYRSQRTPRRAAVGQLERRSRSDHSEEQALPCSDGLGTRSTRSARSCTRAHPNLRTSRRHLARADPSRIHHSRRSGTRVRIRDRSPRCSARLVDSKRHLWRHRMCEFAASRDHVSGEFFTLMGPPDFQGHGTTSAGAGREFFRLKGPPDFQGHGTTQA
jgi:hypothetical protein